MKKLMIASAAVLAAASVMATVESANVVGYAAGSDTVDQFNFVTIPFNAIGYNTSDIQQLQMSDGGAGSIGWGTETFAIWAGAPELVDDTSFVYYDPSMDPAAKETGYYWGDGDGNKAAFSIIPGQGVVVQCAADLGVQCAGQVQSAPATLTTVDQFNFTGNPFPAAIDINNIKISDKGAGSIGWGTETFAVWAGAPELVADTSYVYYDPSMDPAGEATDYYWGDGDGNKATYSIPAGRGVVIQCAADLDVTITPPYSL